MLERFADFLRKRLHQDIIFTEYLSAHSICPDRQSFIRIDPVDESPDRGDVFFIQRIITDLCRCFDDSMVLNLITPNRTRACASRRTRPARPSSSVIEVQEGEPTTSRMQPGSYPTATSTTTGASTRSTSRGVELHQEAAGTAVDVDPRQLEDGRLHVDRHRTSEPER